MLDLRRLRLLCELAHRKTISATAKALGYSPSAVSQQLATLERETGASLLNRAAHSIELTRTGRRLVEHGKQILALVEMAEAQLHADNGKPSGHVTVGAFPTAAVAFAPMLARNLRKYSTLTLRLRQLSSEVTQSLNRSEGMNRVITGEIDIALVDRWNHRVSSQKRSGLYFRRLLHDPLVLVMPRDHPSAHPSVPVNLEALRSESWMATPEGEPSRSAVDQLLAPTGASPVQWEFEGLSTILGLVSRGMGIAAVPALALAGGDYPIAVRETPGEPIIREIYAVTRTNSLRRPAIAVTLDAIYTTAQELQDICLAYSTGYHADG